MLTFRVAPSVEVCDELNLTTILAPITNLKFDIETVFAATLSLVVHSAYGGCCHTGAPLPLLINLYPAVPALVGAYHDLLAVAEPL